MATFSLRFVVFVGVVLLSSLWTSLALAANLAIPTGTESVYLSTLTGQIRPNTTINLELNAYTINMAGATVRWYVNEVEVTDSRNERSLKINTGDLGTSKVVEVVIHRPSGPPVRTSYTVTPSVIDIILEATTYTPPFYTGRALPSSRSTVRAIAIPHIGKALNPSTLSYDWRLGDDAVGGGIALGKQVIEFEMPRFHNQSISVTVYDTQGTVVGNERLVLNPIEPELLFYEFNPLRGLDYRALTNNSVFIGDEIVVEAAPFHMNADLSRNGTSYRWFIDGMTQDNPYEPPLQIVLNKQGEVGSARIGLELITKRTIPQKVRADFGLNFSQ